MFDSISAGVGWVLTFTLVELSLVRVEFLHRKSVSFTGFYGKNKHSSYWFLGLDKDMIH